MLIFSYLSTLDLDRKFLCLGTWNFIDPRKLFKISLFVGGVALGKFKTLCRRRSENEQFLESFLSSWLALHFNNFPLTWIHIHSFWNCPSLVSYYALIAWITKVIGGIITITCVHGASHEYNNHFNMLLKC